MSGWGVGEGEGQQCRSLAQPPNQVLVISAGHLWDSMEHSHKEGESWKPWAANSMPIPSEKSATGLQSKANEHVERMQSGCEEEPEEVLG